MSKTKQKNTRQQAGGETIRFQDVDIFVRSVGSGTPVLLINGLGAHTAMWHAMETTLKGFRLLQFDLPGAGESTTPRRPIPIAGLAQLATQVLDHFGVKKAHVIGYSMGGMVSQQLAHDDPGRVDRVVLLATGPGRGSYQGDLKATINMFTPARYLSPRIYALTIGSMVGGRARHDTEWVAEQGLLRLRQSPSWRGYIWQLLSVMKWSGLPILRNVEQRVLVFAGDDDPLIPVVNPMMLTHLLPNGRLHVMNDEGHLMAMNPDSGIHPLIRSFLSAASPESTTAWRSASKVDADELELAMAGASVLPLPMATDARARRRWLRDPAERQVRAATGEA
jgi:pimeloyl-ACP methyl ester carboxylesterase